jgi:apolipoprotein D and lipocalin family protein
MHNRTIAVLVAFLSIFAGGTSCTPPQTVEYVEPGRYLGTWYEIARYPNAFQASCSGNTTATYSPHPDMNLDIVVENRCQENSPEGDYQEIIGRASFVDDGSNAKLNVYFFGNIGAPYWIIELDDTVGDDPYAWAVVSDPIRLSLWILSRTPGLEVDVLNMILEKITNQGYSTERLLWTPQE